MTRSIKTERAKLANNYKHVQLLGSKLIWEQYLNISLFLEQIDAMTTIF